MKTDTPQNSRIVSGIRTQKHPAPLGSSKPMPKAVEKALKSGYAFELPPGCEDIASVFADASVTAPLNAAQHLHLSQLAIRHRCTVGELIAALALCRLDEDMAEFVTFKTHEGRDFAITDALLRFVDAGRTPNGGPAFDLPNELIPGPIGELEADMIRREHTNSIPHLAYLAGDLEAYEKAEQADRIREALKPWKK